MGGEVGFEPPSSPQRFYKIPGVNVKKYREILPGNNWGCGCAREGGRPATPPPVFFGMWGTPPVACGGAGPGW